MRKLPPVIASAILLAQMLIAAPTDAAVIAKYANRNPAGACTLSVPSTNSGIRANAATGFGNVGSSNIFVICSFDIVNDDSATGFNQLSLTIVSLDGLAHNVSCTAMDRDVPSNTGDYSTKSVSVPAFSEASVNFLPADFPNTHLIGWNASITCNLSRGTSIISAYSAYGDNVGN